MKLPDVIRHLFRPVNDERAEKSARLDELEVEAKENVRQANRALNAGERLHGYRVANLRRR